MAEYYPEQGDGDSEGNSQEIRKQRYRARHTGKDLRALALAFQKAYWRKDDAELELKEANDEFDVLRFELIPTRMEEDGVEKVNYDGIGRLGLAADVRVTCLKAQKPMLFGWLKKHKLGDLLREDINASTLKAWVKNRMKAGKELPPDDLLKVEAVTRASITKG